MDNADRPRVEYVEGALLRYREACRLIKDDTTDFEQRYAKFRETRRKLWSEREPATADFLDAVRAGQGDKPQVYLARGKRLAELKRWEAAEADFNKAVELKPDSSEIRAARAFFYADWEKLDQAVSDLNAAYQLIPENRFFFGQDIDLRLAGRDALFARFAPPDQLASHALGVYTVRMIREGRWNEVKVARDVIAQNSKWPFIGAAASLMLEEPKEFERILQVVADDYERTGNSPEQLIQTAMLAPYYPERAAKVQAAVARLAREQPGRGDQFMLQGKAEDRRPSVCGDP